MEIESLLACNSIGENKGKINLEGLIDRLPMDPLTGKIREFCVFLRLRWDISDLRRAHRLVLNLIDFDGISLAPPILTTEFPTSDKHTNMVFPIRDIFVHDCAEHRLDLFIDGLLRASLPLLIYRQHAQVR